MCEVITHAAEGFVRLSILLFYRVILRDVPNKYFTWTLWLVFILVIVTWLSFLIAFAFACQPASAFWLQFSYDFTTTTHYTCYDHPLFLIISSSINAVLDVLLSLMPIPFLWSLKLSLRKKVGVFLLLGSFGIAASFSAVRRIYWIWMAFYETTDPFDFTWNLYGALLWTALECALALIGSSLPAMKALWSHVGRQQKKQDTKHRKQIASWQRVFGVVTSMPLKQYWRGEQRQDLPIRLHNDSEKHKKGVEAAAPAGKGWITKSVEITITTDFEAAGDAEDDFNNFDDLRLVDAPVARRT